MGVALPGSLIWPTREGGGARHHVPNNVWEDLALSYNPWAKWPLNEPAGSGTCADHSGHGRTLTANAPQVTLGVRGNIPTSGDTCAYCTFSGAANLLYFNSVATQPWASANALSIEVWANVNSQGGTEKSLVTFGSISSAASFNWWLLLSAGVLTLRTTIGGVQTSYTLGGNVLNSGVHQLFVVLDGTNVTGYVDSVQQTQVAQTAAIGTGTSRTVYLNQGTGGAGARAWGGTLGPVVVWDTVITPAQILALWTAATTT